MEIRMNLPDGATQRDLVQFLEYLKSRGEEVNPAPLKKRPEESCSNCFYQENHKCNMFSVDCATRVSQRGRPSLWAPLYP